MFLLEYFVRRIPLILSLLAVASMGIAVPMTNQQATDAGTALGTTQDALITPGITAANANTNIPHVTATPAETQFFGGGRADNYTPGDNKRIACDTGAPDPDPFKQQSCNAINTVANGPSQRPAITIDRTNPMLQRELVVRANASSIVSSGLPADNPNGFGLAGTYSGCTTTTTPDPGTVEIRTCTDYMTATETAIDNACQKSVNTTQTCHQTLTFTVTQPASVPATPSYSCPTGSVLIGSQCQPYTYAATVNYSCSAGSTLSGTTCQPAPSTATLSYSCTTGTLSGTQCQYPAISATMTYSCPSGGTLSGTTCVGATVNATVTYSCAAGETLVNGNQCQAPATQGVGVAATATIAYSAGIVQSGPYYSFVGCPAGATPVVEGGMYVPCNANAERCDVVGCNWTENYRICASSPTYTCPSGYTLSGTTCYPPMVTPPPTAATATYSCPGGYSLSGTSCTAPSYSATANYSCASGQTLSGISCFTPSTAATASYSCPTNTTLSGTNCFPPPVGATVAYTCPSPATLTGTNCQPPNTTATVTYTCGPGMVMSGTTCTPAAVVQEVFTDNCANLQARTTP